MMCDDILEADSFRSDLEMDGVLSQLFNVTFHRHEDDILLSDSNMEGVLGCLFMDEEEPSQNLQDASDQDSDDGFSQMMLNMHLQPVEDVSEEDLDGEWMDMIQTTNSQNSQHVSEETHHSNSRGAGQSVRSSFSSRDRRERYQRYEHGIFPQPVYLHQTLIGYFYHHLFFDIFSTRPYENQYVSQSLSTKQIALLPSIEMTKDYIEKNSECTICLIQFEINDKATQLPCHHFFHNGCISEWLKNKATCPTCRQDCNK